MPGRRHVFRNGPYLQGIRAVIAQTYERIHHSNLIGMGILPLQVSAGDSMESLGLGGEEVFDLIGLNDVMQRGAADGNTLRVRAAARDGQISELEALVRIGLLP